MNLRRLWRAETTRTIDTDGTAYNNPIRSNRWYQLTFTFGAGGMKLYLDGNLVGSNSYTGGLTGNAQPIVIGASNATNRNDSGDLSRITITDPFDGYIDEVAFFGTALSADQIQQSRQRGAMGVGENVLPGAAPLPLPLADQTQAIASPVTPNTPLRCQAVIIDWARQAAPAPKALQQAARWLADFVNDLGSSQGERNPNDALRLTPPTKIAPLLSKRL